MAQNNIGPIVEQIEPLQAVLVTTVPDCLLCASWLRDGEKWDPDAGAAYFGDLVRANRAGLELLAAWSTTMQITVESGDRLLVLRQVNAGLVIAFVFEREAPLGLVRLHISRALGEIERTLTMGAPKAVSRGQRLLDYLKRYAPDTHTALLRVSLQTGLPLGLLTDPDSLSDAEFGQVTTSVRQILGLDHLTF